MPDLKDPQDVPARPDDIATHALGLVARDDHDTPVPQRIEDAVMRAWDTRGKELSRRRHLVRPAWAALAAAACAVLAAALWMTEGRKAPPTIVATPAISPSDPSPAAGAVPLESIAPVDVLLQEDPASLRLVRLSVQPSVLVALGYPLADPAETQPLDVEVLVGLDGVPRAVRRAGYLPNRE